MSLETYCVCCLLRPPCSDVKNQNTVSDKTEVEVYADMIKECFDINVVTDEEHQGICTVCFERLQDAVDFKRKVVRCQTQLQITKGYTIADKVKEENFDVKEELPDPDDDYNMCLYDDAIHDTLKLEDGNVKTESNRNKKSQTHTEKTDSKTRKQTEASLTEFSSDDEKPILTNKSLSDHEKFKLNIKNILTYSNCTPFSNKTIGGVICDYCKVSYKNMELLSRHCKESHPRELGETKKYYQGSISIKMDITNLKCNVCHAKLDFIADLKNHLSTEHDILFYKDVHDYILEFRLADSQFFSCALCDLQFETFKMLVQHMNEHYRNFICDVCNQGFINVQKLRYHKNTHEIGKFKFGFCDKVFSRRVRMLCHEKYTHNSSAMCPHCDQSFTNYYQRNIHMRREHNIAATYKCNICDKSFIMKSKLTGHVKKVHLMERKHKCTECGQSFFEKQALDQHVVKHNGPRIHKCTVCEKSYARKNALVVHMRSHNNDRRFKCGLCVAAFVQKSTLKSHMVSIHGVTLEEFEAKAEK